MKKSILLFAVIFISISTFAQNRKFEVKMKSTLAEMKMASETNNFLSVANKYDKLANDFSNKTEPLYYSAYCRIQQSFRTPETNAKDSLLNISKKSIDKALLLEPNNPELYVLSALNYQAAISVNPAERGRSYSSKASVMLKKANELQNDNPRVLFLTGQNVFYRPTQFGGGAENAKPYFEKAAKIFQSQKTTNFSPIWGEITNAEMLEKCN